MSELKSISSYCGFANPPGLVKVDYLPINWINQTAYELRITASWHLQADIPIAINEWLSLPLLPTRRPWNERQRRNRPGKYFEQTVSGITQLLRPDVSGQFDAMAEHRYLLRIQDRQGKQWLIGTLENPIAFFCDGETGNPDGGLNHYALRFTGQTIHRAYGLN